MAEVTRPRASKPFVESGNSFLWFCLAVRDSGIAASRRLNITDEWIAQDLDNAVSYRLLVFDNEMRADQIKASAKLIAIEVGKMFGGGTTSDEPDEDMSGVEVW